MFSVDPGSHLPPYAQLHVQVVDGARSGALPAGTRLPTVRALAEQLGIAPNTVAKAYRELEQDGVIETRGRGGTFVAWSADTAERGAQEAAAAFADRIRLLGVAPAHAIDLVRGALAPL
ncbi:MAG TPA: GntR family transcriptional regulator [Pseudolysinimonas sp.]|nr:GntR family transcriptional regulator [Pseudolysinimonas sp.]